MVDRTTMEAMLPKAFRGSEGLGPSASGKVREWRGLGDGRRLLVTTDRISAFDRVIGAVPWKGQVLNELSAWWNAETADILPNHLLSQPDPNASIVMECRPLPVEVVVRGYITGVTSTSLWQRYAEGDRRIYGYDFAERLEKNRPLPEPIITPTTKAEAGAHDERLDWDEVPERGLVDTKLWARVMEAALALFARGTGLAARGGLILVDTKYEFGIDLAGRLVLIDEIHTPDSSRFWKAESYESRLASGLEPENLDKEFVRMKYARLGYRGEGPIPVLDGDAWVDTGLLYQTAFEALTGLVFRPGDYPIGPRLEKNLEKAGIRI